MGNAGLLLLRMRNNRIGMTPPPLPSSPTGTRDELLLDLPNDRISSGLSNYGRMPSIQVTRSRVTVGTTTTALAGVKGVRLEYLHLPENPGDLKKGILMMFAGCGLFVLMVFGLLALPRLLPWDWLMYVCLGAWMFGVVLIWHGWKRQKLESARVLIRTSAGESVIYEQHLGMGDWPKWQRLDPRLTEDQAKKMADLYRANLQRVKDVAMAIGRAVGA